MAMIIPETDAVKRSQSSSHSFINGIANEYLSSPRA